jgi:hypothetical protein
MATASMPELCPALYSASPIRISVGSIRAPEAASTRSVASMISGPMPSPWAMATGSGWVGAAARAKCAVLSGAFMVMAPGWVLGPVRWEQII